MLYVDYIFKYKHWLFLTFYYLKQFSRACEKTSAEILEIKRQQRATNKEINKLRRALTAATNAQERCLAIEAVAEYKVN